MFHDVMLWDVFIPCGLLANAVLTLSQVNPQTGKHVLRQSTPLYRPIYQHLISWVGKQQDVTHY